MNELLIEAADSSVSGCFHWLWQGKDSEQQLQAARSLSPALPWRKISSLEEYPMHPVEASALMFPLEIPSLSALGTSEGPHKDQVGARYMVHLPVASRSLHPDSQGQAV